MELSEFLFWLIGPGAGIAGYFIIKNLKFTIKNFVFDLEALSSKAKRRLGILLPGGVAAVAYTVAVGLGYKAAPGTVQAWGEALFYVASAAVVAQLTHGEKEL